MQDLVENHKFINSNSKCFMNFWKELRKKLTIDLSDQLHLEMVTNFWSQSPISTRAIDWDAPHLWPNPWELINDFKFDESSVALGMFYTLMLSHDQRWTLDRMELMLVKDHVRQIQQIILKVDNQWLLNLEYNSVLDSKKITNNYIVQQRYSFDGKIHLPK